MLHRNAARRALEKELALLQKREGRMEARALAEKEGAWKAKLEEKVPEKVYTSLEQAFCKAFALVFEKGTGIIEKSYDRDALEKDYAVRDFAVQVKGDRRTLRRFPKENRGANAKNLLIVTGESKFLAVQKTACSWKRPNSPTLSYKTVLDSLGL